MTKGSCKILKNENLYENIFCCTVWFGDWLNEWLTNIMVVYVVHNIIVVVTL